MCLYLITVSVEIVVGGAARFLLAYPLAVMASVVLQGAPSADTVAIAAALLPVCHSLGGLILPGPGWWWRRRAGLRRPSAEELEVLTLAFELFSPARPLPRIAVLDDALPFEAVRGTTVIVSRGLVESTSLAPALAHECGHLQSLDGRLTEALARLAVWDDPLAPPLDFEGRDTLGRDRDLGGGLLYFSLRLLVRLAGGGQVRRVFGPLWSAYWLRREFAADAAAAAVGQGPDLARYLRDEVLPFDVSRPVGLFNHSKHPPTALRIERLVQANQAGGTK